MDKISYALWLGIGHQINKIHIEQLSIDEFAQSIAHGGNCRAHVDKTHEKNAEAHTDGPDRTGGSFLYEHYGYDAYDKSYRREIFRFKKIEYTAFACLQIHKSEYLRGYGSADIGAENDADRLAECTESRSNQTNSQYYSRGRTLYHTCDQKPKDESHDRFVGHFGKSRFHGAAGTALQSVAHEPHSVQEQSKSA